MTCSMDKLMQNGFCAETGLECPRDARCAQWDVNFCPRGLTSFNGCIWRGPTGFCFYPTGSYFECPFWHGLEMEDPELNQSIKTEPAGVKITDVCRKPWGIDSVDDDAAWLFQDEDEDENEDEDVKDPSWVDHDLLNNDLAWACQLNKKAEQLANEHWAYIEQVIRYEHSDENEAYIERVGFHYRTAMIHGFKHGVEYAKEAK